MTELGKDNNNNGVDFASATPIEVSVNADGTKDVIFNVSGTSSEAMEEMVKRVEEINGSPMVPLKGKGKAFAALSSRTWNAKWEPTGPRPNWVTTNPENN